MDLRYIVLLSLVLVGCLVLQGCGGEDPDDEPTTTPRPKPTTTLLPTPPPGKWNKTTTTRYWDCSGGACGGDERVECPNQDCTPPFPGDTAYCAPYSWAPKKIKYAPLGGVEILYAAAAASDPLYCGKEKCEDDGWGDDAGCGKCYLLQNPTKCEDHAGKNPAPKATSKIILRTSNLCPGKSNEHCADGKLHFDISAPGFDHSATSVANVCKNDKADCDPSVYGSDVCANVPFSECDCSKVADEKVLVEGCENFVELGWDNCAADFMEVPCPEEFGELEIV